MGKANTDDFGGTVSAYERHRIGYRLSNTVLRRTGAHEIILIFYFFPSWLEKNKRLNILRGKNVLCHVPTTVYVCCTHAKAENVVSTETKDNTRRLPLNYLFKKKKLKYS